MEMKRSFIPVGQGAFYHEKFEIKNGNHNENINIVYDCGTSDSQGLVEDAIKNTFFEDEIINAIFISHLDRDHISGLKTLLTYCEVKNIFFPLINNQNKKLLKVEKDITNNNGDGSGGGHSSDLMENLIFADSFLENPLKSIDPIRLKTNPNLFAVQAYNQEIDEKVRNDYLFIESIEDLKEKQSNIGPDKMNLLAPGVSIPLDVIYTGTITDDTKFKEWYFVPFNFQSKNRVKKLFNALYDEFSRSIGNNELLNLWRENNPDNVKRIKNAYKKVNKNLNINTMTIFSGDTTKNLKQYILKPEKYQVNHYKNPEKESGALYTGDYDASGAQRWEKLKEHYEDYWQLIGCLQVPHHGSRSDFNDRFLELNSYFVISAGDRVSHPSRPVLMKFLNNHLISHIVGKAEESLMELIIK